MRVLGVGETCDLGALYLSLAAEGHEVRTAVSHPLAQGTMAGLVAIVPDWRAQLDWIRAAGADGVILFESVSEGFGELQDALRRDGFNVIGGSAYGDRLENDRAYAQQLLAKIGLATAPAWSFPTAAEAADFVRKRPGRYVVKRSGAEHSAGDTYVGMLADGRDVVALLRGLPHGEHPAGWLLMEFVEGLEMGVGAYFNGERFLTPACLDWEHKRFFAGDLGELTGEMGTVATYDRTAPFFAKTLARLEPRLRDAGYVGYINLNTIVNEAGIWPLEFTCRFGYPGYAVLAPLQRTPWGELFRRMVARTSPTFDAREGYSVGIVLTTPPFPYSREQVEATVGMPVLFDTAADPANFHYGEVGRNSAGELVTSGLYGWTMVATGTGPTVAAAKAAAYRHARQVAIPNLRYRLDIGDALIAGGLARLERFGVFGDAADDG
jgi:phosphoribosylamine---glycine ligase